MSMTVESVSATQVLTNVETTFCTLAAAHATCEIVVDPNGQVNAVGSEWSLYDVSASGIETLIGKGIISFPSTPVRVYIDATPVAPNFLADRVRDNGVVGIQGGGFFRLKGRSTKGATALAITATLNGFSPDGDIAASEEVAAAAILDTVETTFATLAAEHEFCEVLVNCNGDLNAKGSTWRLYEVQGAATVKIAEGVIDNPATPARVFTRVMSSALVRVTGQAKNEPTAVNVNVALIGYDPTAGAGPGGVLAGDVIGPLGSNTVVAWTGATGVDPLGIITAHAQTYNFDAQNAEDAELLFKIGTAPATVTDAESWRIHAGDAFTDGATSYTLGGYVYVQSGKGYAAGIEDNPSAGSICFLLGSRIMAAFQPTYAGVDQPHLGFGPTNAFILFSVGGPGPANLDGAVSKIYASEGFDFFAGIDAGNIMRPAIGMNVAHEVVLARKIGAEPGYGNAAGVRVENGYVAVVDAVGNVSGSGAFRMGNTSFLYGQGPGGVGDRPLAGIDAGGYATFNSFGAAAVFLHVGFLFEGNGASNIVRLFDLGNGYAFRFDAFNKVMCIEDQAVAGTEPALLGSGVNLWSDGKQLGIRLPTSILRIDDVVAPVALGAVDELLKVDVDVGGGYITRYIQLAPAA